MATKSPSPAQLAARERFAEMARSGSLNRKRQIAAKKRKANPGLYDNINAKRERIAAGSGERMRRPGTKGAPTEEAFKRSAKTARKSNPTPKKSVEVWEVAIMKPGVDKKFIPIAHYFKFQDAEKYALYLHKKEKLDVRVITTEM